MSLHSVFVYRSDFVSEEKNSCDKKSVDLFPAPAVVLFVSCFLERRTLLCLFVCCIRFCTPFLLEGGNRDEQRIEEKKYTTERKKKIQPES